ncbi:MAG TPA: hypothetical protein VMO17_14830 [Terriglobia bacterium]|nr:hypothetical protein [Terriglobia bacterium]
MTVLQIRGPARSSGCLLHILLSRLYADFTRLEVVSAASPVEFVLLPPEELRRNL